MHDEDTGSAQQGGWQPPEYVSPWLPASSSPQGDDANDTIAYRSGPGYESGQQPTDGRGYPAGPGYGGYAPADPGYGAAGSGYGPAGPGYGPAYGGAPGGSGGSDGPGYGGPGYGQPGYGGPGYGGPGYGQPGYGQNPWGGYGAPPPPSRSGFSRTLAYLAVAVLAAGAGAGVAVALNHNTSGTSALSPSSGTGNGGSTGGGALGGGSTGGGAETNPFAGNGFGGLGGSGNGNAGNSGGSTNSGTGSLNVSALSAKVDPGLVDVISDLGYSGDTAEGTGMIISSSGLVLTNNHVIDQSTSVTAQVVVSGKTYKAKVVGYNSTNDVALLQLVGASGLKTVSISNSGVKVGQAVLALGNAGGRGGLPSTAEGTIQALDQSISASDEGAGTTEKLHGMLETDAPIQQGDSGGPLVNASGKVVGMDTAAGPSGNSLGGDDSGTSGFAIPIKTAISIADQINAGKASTTVHIGLSGFMGVNVANASAPSDCGTDASGTGVLNPAVSSGALVCDVYPGAPAAVAGLTGGDVITSVNGTAVKTATGLTNLMSGDHPGAKLDIVYVDQSGARHSTTVTLTEWAR